jgi:hypothetical protein
MSVFMQVSGWVELPRGDIAPHNSGVYVTMNRKGEIALNKVAYKRIGEPNAFLILYNRPNTLIALKPAAAAIKNAYPVRKHGRRGGRMVRAFRLLTEFGIKLPDTVEFPGAEIDPDGQLILDLRTARVSPRAHSQCRTRKN